MIEPSEKESTINLTASVKDILACIEQDREREIISRRFGLYDRRETLEQIGELLGITRERVRQLEKAILSRLRTATENGKIPVISTLEKAFVRKLTEMGRIARVQDLADGLLNKTGNQKERSSVAFIAELSPALTIISENDNYFHSVGISEYGDAKKVTVEVDAIVTAIKKHGEPITIEQLHEQLSYDHPDHVRALASVSKQLAHLKDSWGLLSKAAVSNAKM
jgi:hypothetical protein